MLPVSTGQRGGGSACRQATPCWSGLQPTPGRAVACRRARVRGGYTLTAARTGAPVARLKPMPTAGRYEVLLWRREAWGSAGPFGAVLGLDDALAFIAAEPAFWIRT